MMKFCRFALTLGALTLCLEVSPPTALAQQTWDNDAADQNWDDPTNWTGDMFPDGVNAIVNTDTAGQQPIISATPTLTPNDIIIGDGGGAAGRLDQTAGSAATGGGAWMFVGRGGNTGTYNLADTSVAGGGITGFGTGSGDITAGVMWLGGADFNDNGVGVVNINTTGSLNTTGDSSGGGMILGGGWDGGIGDATVNLENGTVNVSAQTYVGRAGTGVWNQTGGTLNSTGFLVVGREGGGGGNYTVGDGTINLSGGTINAATGFGFGTIGALSSATESATGEVNISGGSYIVGDPAGNLASQLIGENGLGFFNVIGTAGSIDILGDLHLGLDIGGVDTGGMGTLGFVADSSGVSIVNVGGNVNLDSPDGDFLTVDLTGYTGPWVDMLLVDGTTSQGEFTGLSQGTTVAFDGNANPYTIDYSVGGDVWLRAGVIPEPASLVLLSMASLAIIGRRRR